MAKHPNPSEINRRQLLRRMGAGALIFGLLSSVSAAAGPAVTPYNKVRYAGVVRQALDFSCGAAALATLVKYYWGFPASEKFVLDILHARYPAPALWKKKLKDGFSFDDIEFAAAALGFNAQGFKLPLDELTKLEGPVIVHLDQKVFQHFSVLKKLHGDTAYLADPIVGNVGLDITDFAKRYTGNAMAVWREGAPLPKNAPLARVRDGISVNSVVGRLLRRPATPLIHRF